MIKQNQAVLLTVNMKRWHSSYTSLIASVLHISGSFVITLTAKQKGYSQ